MTTSPNLGIPQLSQAQANPDVTHNEALMLIQALLNGVIRMDLTAPPGSPAEGDAYLIDTAAPTGAWSGHARAVAIYWGGSWRFVPGVNDVGTPITMGAGQEGLTVYVRAEEKEYRWTGTGSPATYSWEEVASGGGSVGPTPPTAASFTLYKDGGTTATMTDQVNTQGGPSGVLLSVLGAAADRNVCADRVVPGATWIMTAKLKAGMAFGNYRAFGLYARDNATGRIDMYALAAGDLTHKRVRRIKWTNLTTYSSDTAPGVQVGDWPEWHRLELDATNLIYSVSYDGVNFTPWLTQAKANFVAAITHCGVMAGINQSSVPTGVYEYLLIEQFSLT